MSRGGKSHGGPTKFTSCKTATESYSFFLNKAAPGRCGAKRKHTSKKEWSPSRTFWSKTLSFFGQGRDHFECRDYEDGTDAFALARLPIVSALQHAFLRMCAVPASWFSLTLTNTCSGRVSSPTAKPPV